MAVRKLKSGKWQADYWDGPKRVRKTLDTKNEARLWESVHKAKRKHAKPKPERTYTGTRSMREAVEWYLGTSRVQTLQPETIAKYTQRLSQFMEWCDTNNILLVTDYTLEVAEKRTRYLRANHKRKGLAARFTLENAVLRTEMQRQDTAMTWNPHGQVDRRVKLVTGNPDYLKPDESAWLRDRANPRELACMDLLYNTAMRPIEVRNLEWRQVLPDMIVLSKTKNGKSRGVPLNKKAREALAFLRQETGGEKYVLLGDRPANHSYFNAMFKRMCKRISQNENVPFRFYPYLFRKTNASRALINGASIEDAAEMLGNTPIMIQKYYGALTLENARRVSDLLEKIDTDTDTKSQKPAKAG